VLENLTGAILKSDVPGIIGIVAEMDRAGKDLQRVVMELMEHFRNLLVVLYAGKGSSALELPDAQMKFYVDRAAKTEAGRVLRIIDALVETDGRMRYALSKKTLLETGLIRCSRAAETATLNELLKQVAELKKNFKSGAVSGVVAETPAQSYSVDPQKKKPPIDEVKLLLDCWNDVVDHVSKADPLSRRYFLDTAPLRTDATHLVVGFDPEFASEKERFDNARTKLALARVVEKHIGRMLGVLFEPLKPDTRKPLPSDHMQEPTGLKKWYANPVVKTVVEAFNGEISDIRE
jgi:DNA polymerase-3 subunit gamma/tau